MILTLIEWLRLIIGLLDLAILTLIMYVLSFLPQKILGDWYRKLFRYWCKVFVRALRVDLFLHQKNKYPLPERYILIGNHPSAFEDVGMSALFDVRFLAKIEVKDWWLVGRIGQAAGTLYVQRESKESRQEANGELRQALEKHNIGLYPEGGCKGRRINLPFRRGVFDIALQTKIPIVPVFLHYEAQESFEWYQQTLLYKLWTIMMAQNRRANYYIYDAIDPTLFTSKEALCEHVQNLYLNWQAKYLD